MISLKFIDGVLYQSVQMHPGGQWTDYHPVPSEGKTRGTPAPKEKSLVEKVIEVMKISSGFHVTNFDYEKVATAIIDTIKREEGEK